MPRTYGALIFLKKANYDHSNTIKYSWRMQTMTTQKDIYYNVENANNANAYFYFQVKEFFHQAGIHSTTIQLEYGSVMQRQVA